MLKDGENGVILQRDRQSYAIAPHLPCGLVTPNQLRAIADTSERYGCRTLKITSAARIAMIGLSEDHVTDAWREGPPV